MEIVKGFDSRYWNGIMPPGYDYKYVGIKISGGVDFVPVEPQKQWRLAPDQGLKRLPFHYWRGKNRVTYRGTDPKEWGKKQAHHFFETKMKWSNDIGELPPCMDVEDKYSIKGLWVIDSMWAFLERTEQLWGKKPMIYTAGWWWNTWAAPYANYYSTWSPYDYDLWEADPPPDTPCGEWEESMITQVVLDWSAPGFNAKIDVNHAQKEWYNKQVGESGEPPPNDITIKVIVPEGVKVDVQHE